jgi:hypothetical protein
MGDPPGRIRMLRMIINLMNSLVKWGWPPVESSHQASFVLQYSGRGIVSEDRWTLARMIEPYKAVREAGLLNVKPGNCGRFARAPEESETLLAAVGPESIR